MRGLPFVPFFTSDWLASSARVDMSLPARAIYLDLLFHIWERGGAIPADEAKLAKLAMVTPAEFSAAWPEVRKHLVAHPDEPEMLTNLKMLDVIRKQASNYRAQSQNGRKGGIASGLSRKRKRTGNEAETNHLEPELEPTLELEKETENTSAPLRGARLRDASFSSKRMQPCREEKKATAEQEEWFEQFWDAFWLKKSRKRAFDVFVSKVQSPEMFERVMEAVKSQSPEMLAREPQRRPYPETFIAEERWSDEVAEPARPMMPKIDGWD